MQTIITKPWGREIILTPPNSPYTSKILELKAGHQLSLQYHDQKTETLTLLSGEAEITLDNKRQMMDLKCGYHIGPNTIHRIKAFSDCLIIEASTPETGTTFRLEDDYQRSDETALERNLPNRGYSN